MATLQKIRTRAGILIAIVIGAALLAFVLGDFLSQGGSLFSSSENNIAEVSGKSIPYKLFQQRIDELIENTKRQTQQKTLDEETLDMLYEQAWDQLIREIVMQDEYAELGIGVSADELFDMVQGNNIDLQIQQIPVFQNPATGQFDRSRVIQFLKNLDQDQTGEARADWLAFENLLVQKRIIDKYNNLIKKGLYITSHQAKTESQERNNKVNFSYIVQKYISIPDSGINVTDDEIMEYYKKHLNNYEQEASRDVEYVTFEVLPSEGDINAIEQWIYKIKEEFGAADDDKQFVNLNADTPFDEFYYKQDELPEQLDTFIFNVDTGFVYGPYTENDAYKLAKLSVIKYLPDSVKARHILITPDEETQDYSKAIEMVDSLKALIEQGADFTALALRHSADTKANEKGGDLGWFKKEAMVKPFSDSCFFHNKGDITTALTQFGAHLIEITDRSEEVKKVQVAILDRIIEPSSRTYQDIYSKVSEFAGVNNTKEKFVNAISEQGLTKRIANNIKEIDKRIAGLERPRQLVRWAYKAEKNDISPIFEFGNRFVVAVLTEVREKGTAPLEQIRNEIETLAKKDKKAQQLIKKITPELNKCKTLNALAQKLNTNIEEAKNISFSSFSIPGAGVEPNVIASAVCIEKNKLSRPIKGNNGVYVVVVDSIIQPQDTDYTITKQRLINSFQSRVDYNAYEALKESANIIDNRARFY